MSEAYELLDSFQKSLAARQGSKSESSEPQQESDGPASKSNELSDTNAAAEAETNVTVSPAEENVSTGSDSFELIPKPDSPQTHRGKLIAQRFSKGSLFSRALQRYASLFTQRDRKELALIVNQAAREFADLCPEGVSEIEIVAAERVAIARMKTLVYDLLVITPEAWRDPQEFLGKRQARASRELDHAMRAFMALRRAATSQPGFRVTVSETRASDAVGAKSTTQMLRFESLPAEPDGDSE